MDLWFVAAALLSAVLHAGWNAAVKAQPKPAEAMTAQMVLSALLVMLGAAWLLDLVGAVTLDAGLLLALALGIVGAGLLVSTWFGRARGLIALGALLALALGTVGIMDVPLRGGIGDPHYRPRHLAGSEARYELAIGAMVLDLRDLDWVGTQRIRATVGIGSLKVLVPEGAGLRVSGRSGAGVVTILERRTRSCCPAELEHTQRGSGDDGRVVLVAKVGMGEVRVSDREDLRGPS